MPLSDVKGQDRACESLLRALNGERLHHAYLFAGPEGVGKTLAARHVAQAMLCPQSRPNGDGCGECNVCLRVHAGQHADVHIVERKTSSDGRLDRQIKIDQIRALQQSLSYKAFEGSRRVILVLEADKMTASTANAMLKTLEEPGRATHFILVSDAAHRLLPTIISRCQRVNFAPLDINFVQECLTEQTELPPSESAIVARLAQGSIGRGLAMAELDVFHLRTRLLDALYAETSPPIDILLDLAEELARPDRRDVLPLNFHILRTWHRDLLLLLTNAPETMLVHHDVSARLKDIAQRYTPDAVSDKISRINDAQVAITERMANARLVLEALLIHLSSDESGRSGV